MALSADTAGEHVNQMIALTERLTQLIAAEAQAFESNRPQDAAALVEETSRLANLYRLESMRIRSNPDLIAPAPPEDRKRLLQATEAFDAVLARQGRALEAARAVTEGLVQAIANEVAAQRSRGVGYGPGAQAHIMSLATSITLNQRA
ncbi:MAG: flagellar basal body protein [Phenylobacterium sp.]|uniref:flagellar basal body protein n=1 Tax=Phenylobacterium sp. TaxID=1871053 RepID=UPI0025FBCFAE|nr:flagellar basal body protein [Phenylobacterium sp.]MCA6228084.1 flagellar basal body protein [Phenylobacterium sp.]MCA6231443.1 flagellar basal body protein [Phenylobacterium sp.]MCA6233710.1 flagellar basal body protein [Phenylobacterium sp.]MCA6249528.1 flagellar basal body protein [Phenylobacterium sp.]MCA6252659.1 flagellar basal body protein [Phenylobacterium sp.]